MARQNKQPGRAAATRRRKVALNTLLQIEKPNARQEEEIKVLRSRI